MTVYLYYRSLEFQILHLSLKGNMAQATSLKPPFTHLTDLEFPHAHSLAWALCSGCPLGLSQLWVANRSGAKAGSVCQHEVCCYPKIRGSRPCEAWFFPSNPIDRTTQRSQYHLWEHPQLQTSSHSTPAYLPETLGRNKWNISKITAIITHKHTNQWVSLQVFLSNNTDWFWHFKTSNRYKREQFTSIGERILISYHKGCLILELCQGSQFWNSRKEEFRICYYLTLEQTSHIDSCLDFTFAESFRRLKEGTICPSCFWLAGFSAHPDSLRTHKCTESCWCP